MRAESKVYASRYIDKTSLLHLFWSGLVLMYVLRLCAMGLTVSILICELVPCFALLWPTCFLCTVNAPSSLLYAILSLRIPTLKSTGKRNRHNRPPARRQTIRRVLHDHIRNIAYGQYGVRVRAVRLSLLSFLLFLPSFASTFLCDYQFLLSLRSSASGHALATFYRDPNTRAGSRLLSPA